MIVYSSAAAFWTVRNCQITASVGGQIVCAESFHDKLFSNKALFRDAARCRMYRNVAAPIYYHFLGFSVVPDKFTELSP